MGIASQLSSYSVPTPPVAAWDWIMHFNPCLAEKRDVDDGTGATKAADSLVSFDASSHVLRNLIKPIKMPWEKNPVLNPKRAFCSALSDLGQSVVGMRDFACNTGNVEVSETVVATPNLNHALKRARFTR